MVVVFILLFGSVIGFNFYKQKRIAEYIAAIPEKVFSVTAIEVKTEDWSPELSAIGFISPLQGVTLANEDAGVITLLNFKSGQKVTKGDVLIELDQKVEKANLESAEATLPSVKASYKRNKKLLKKGTISQATYDKTNSDYLSLLSQIESLKAVIARRTVVAPFSGISGLRQVDLGEYIQPGTNVVRLEDITNVRVRFTLPQNTYSDLYIDQPVKLLVSAYPEKNFVGSINAIAPVINPDSGIYNVEAVIQNSDLLLRSGMFAKVQVELKQQSNEIFVPATAINYQLYGNSVFVIEESESTTGSSTGTKSTDKELMEKELAEKELRVKSVTVTLGPHTDDRVLVKSGLSAGQKIVTSGQVRLSNNSLVKIVQSTTLEKPQTIPQL